MIQNNNSNDDFERDIVLQRIKEDEQLKDLREEVDQFRRSQLQSEEKFFNDVAKEHPWFAEYARDAKELRAEESNDIYNRRLGIDYRIHTDRLIEDDDIAYDEALNGNLKYRERIEHWENKLNYEPNSPDIDPENRAYQADHFHLPHDSRPDFRGSTFEFEHEEKPDSFINEYRLKSYEFWRSMNEKYPWDLVDSELKANMVDPILGFLPRRISQDHDIAYEAYSHHSEIEWRVVGDTRMEQRAMAEAERAYEDEMHHQAAQISEELEIALLERGFQDHDDDDLVIRENNPFMGYPANEIPEHVFSNNSTSINQYRHEFEALYELTDDDICEIFQISPSEYEQLRTNDERDR